MLTDKQKAERALALGSSDAPIVAGVSPYCSPLELYYKLTGQLPRYDDEQTEEQEWGNRLEDVIAAAFSEKTGHKVRRLGVRSSTRCAFMVAHLDREIVGDKKGPGVLEIKTRDRSELSRWEVDGIPDEIALQVHHQLIVTNRTWAKIAVLFGRKFRVFELQSDKEIEEYLIELESRFMLRVQRGEPPDHTWTSQSVDLLKKLYPQDSGKTIDLPQHFVETAAGFLAAKQQIDQGEELKSRYEGDLKSAMGEASQAFVPGYQITWKSTKPSQAFDLEQFKAEHPDLYAKYLKQRPGYRRFLCKPSKELLP